MAAKLKKLSIIYIGIAISYIVLSKALLLLTGIIFSNSTIFQGGVLIVEKGVPYKNYWSEELLFYMVMAIAIGTMFSLWQSTRKYSSRIQEFLLSKRLNVTSGILLVFCSVGFIMFSKRIPDPFSNIMAVINAVICLGIIVRWVAKEIYVFKNRKPNKSS